MNTISTIITKEVGIVVISKTAISAGEKGFIFYVSRNTYGKQWVTAMLGSLYKRYGHLNKALSLFQQSKDEALVKKDELGLLNSLHSMVDFFLYWGIPEYANQYASAAISVEKSMIEKNPMVSAQTYINKGRALYQLGNVDSVPLFTEQARKLCQSLPYNSGMVDVNLLYGTFLTDKGGDSLQAGIEELQNVTLHGTDINRAKAYHQLAQTYLKNEKNDVAETMLDSMYFLLTKNETPIYIQLNYEPILKHYLKTKNLDKVEQYTTLMLREEQMLKGKSLKFNLVESIVDLQTEQKNQELRIVKLRETNQRLLLMVIIAVSLVILFVVGVLVIKQRRYYIEQMQKANERSDSLIEELNQSNIEKEMKMQEIREFLKDNDNRQELVTMTPFILKESGETKFRQCFELLHPLFLHRLRERVPSVTRREELLSMLIALNQSTKEISELLSIAPRSVLMLRHRFRQKIGMDPELSLENFIEGILGEQGDKEMTVEAEPENK